VPQRRRDAFARAQVAEQEGSRTGK